MSSLIYLKLDGIRSYCHVGQVNQDNRKAAQQQQTIQFKKPLTLIWGHNGSGKTTIIEALRTATTGVQPPNSEKGRSFLTDSHLLGQSKTDACIELGFCSINEREIVARRHFSIVYDTPNQCKFTSLRSTLQTKSLETGKLETLHSTCANFEKQIPCFLGVSVPILTNVLLCHQEEQLWMFSDNSTLKGIFDELFETTDLVNIETRLRDQLKEAESKAKILAEKVEYSKRDIEDGQRQKLNLQQSMEKIVSEIPVISDIKSQIASIPKQLIDFNTIQSKMSDCADLIAQRNTIQENKMFLRLEKIDLNKLSQQNRVQTNLLQLETDLKNQQQQYDSLQINLENKKNELQELQVDSTIETLKQEVKIIRDQVKSQIQFQNNLSDENLIKLIKEKIISLQLEEKNEQSQNLSLKNNFQNKLQILNEERQQCQINIKINEQKRIEQKKQSNLISEETKQKEMQLQQLIQKKKIAEQQEIKLQEKQRIQTQYEKTNQDLIDCYDISQKNQKISEFLETQRKIQDLQEQAKEAKQKIELIIRDNGWKATLKLNGTKKENISSLGKFEEQIKANLSLIKQQVANEQAQLKVLNEQKQELKTKLSFNKTIKQDEAELENIKKQLREAKENKIKYVFNQTELIDQFTQSCKSTGKCLLCQKPTDQNILDLLKQRVKQNLPKTQAKINEFDQQINQLGANKQRILSVLKNNEFLERIMQLDQQILVIQASLKNSTNEETILQLEKNLEDLEILKQLINNQTENELNNQLQIKNTLQTQYSYLTGQSKLIHNPFNQTQLQKTKNELGIQLKNYESLSQNLENQSQIEENIQKISNDLHQLRLKKQQFQVLEFDEQQEDIQKIEKQIKLVEDEFQTMNNQYMAQIMKLRQLINNLESVLPSLEQKVCKKQELLNKSKNNQKYMEYINALQIEIQKISSQIQIIEDDINSKKEKQQQTKELYEYIEKLSKWQKLDEQEEQLNKKISSLQYQLAQLQDEYQEQQYNKTKYDKLKTEYDLRKCKLEQSFQQIQESKKDISKRYDGSEQIRLELLSELTATYQLISDLKKYLSVLEMTMLECHGQKMKEINKYLFDTWQKIYNGKDIKFIEVKFDEIPNQKKLSKKYNYRLIMRTSNNTEIDMKGRCSMGQKMLASIVFRMALAECFGSNCCFLALDEPTSNLDRQHIKTLSEQLNSLIEFMNQQNQQIQLLIITHDLDLVKMLKKHSDSYYKISKKENGFSTIEERSMDELKG